MPGRHRSLESRTKKIAVAGVATATTSALIVAAAPPPPKPAPAPVVINKDVDLAAGFRPVTDPSQLPDLTGGLGTAGYNLSQAVLDVLLRAVVDHVNLSALASAAGVDLPSLVEQIPTSLLTGVLGAIPINLSGVLRDVLGDVLDPVTTGLLTPLLIRALSLLRIVDAEGNTTLIDLLGLVGLDLSDPLNLAHLDLPGVKLVTAGPAFTLLKLLGLDLGWTPGLTNSVAGQISNTPYLDVGLKGLLNTVLDRLTKADDPLGLVKLLKPIVDGLPIDIDGLQLRVPIVAGFGLGAFAAGAAYDKALADLANQPGGLHFTGTQPILGSFTVVPIVLLRNPGRANGGLFARLFPLAGLLGIDTVTPETQALHSGGTPILNTGLALGGANLLPIKIDATIQYDLMSDFAAWPNPFSVANSLMGAALPTYLLRGIDTSNVTPQILDQVETAVGRALDLDQPLALNLYLTLATNSLPLLEPLYLAADVVDLATFGMLPNPVEQLANALAPALTSLVNLGYTDVVRNPDGTYTRTLDEAGVPTPFMSFPDVNWSKVPGDIINSLVKGFQKEFFSGHPTPSTPNAITGLLKLLTGALDPMGDVRDALKDLPDLLSGKISPLAANAVPSADSKMVTLSADGDASNGKHAASDAAATQADDTAVADEKTGGATTKQSTDETSKDDSTSESTTKPKPKTPRNPVGEAIGGATHAVAGAVGEVTHDVAEGVAGALKNLTPKKKPTSTTKTATDTSTGSTSGKDGASSSAPSKKDAA
jgi:PE-PPE domain